VGVSRYSPRYSLSVGVSRYSVCSVGVSHCPLPRGQLPPPPQWVCPTIPREAKRSHKERLRPAADEAHWAKFPTSEGPAPEFEAT